MSGKYPKHPESNLYNFRPRTNTNNELKQLIKQPKPMSITVTLSKKSSHYPEQNTSPVPPGKIKMLISDVKSDSNTFSIAINFFSKNKSNNDKIEITSIVPENAVKYFSDGRGYAYLDTKDNREIGLKYNETATFDYYYITLNSNTISNDHFILFTIDFA